MSLDRTLKSHGGLGKTRSVLSRAERIARLADEDKFDMEQDSPLGLPKAKVRHSRAGTKSKKAEEKPSADEAGEAAGTPEAQATEAAADQKRKPSGKGKE